MMKRLVIPILITAMLLTQTACPSKQSMLSWSEKAVSGLTKALPMLENAGVNGAKIREAVQIGNQLVAAFKANDNESALGLTSTFITAFEGIVTDTERVSNPATRTTILVVLSIVDLAIRYIADELAEDVPRMSPGLRGAPGVAKLARYREKKKWRCRNASSGRFEKMDFCRQNPASSVVETY